MCAVCQPAHSPPHTAVGACLGWRGPLQSAITCCVPGAGPSGHPGVKPWAPPSSARDGTQDTRPASSPLTPAWTSPPSGKFPFAQLSPAPPTLPADNSAGGHTEFFFFLPSYASPLFSPLPVLGTEPWALHTLGKRFHIKLKYPQLFPQVFTVETKFHLATQAKFAILLLQPPV